MSITVGDDGEEPGPDSAAAIRPRGDAIELLRPRRDVAGDSNGLYTLGLRVSLLDLRLTGDAGAILL